jgi:hypothetical protein
MAMGVGVDEVQRRFGKVVGEGWGNRFDRLRPSHGFPARAGVQHSVCTKFCPPGPSSQAVRMMT